MFAGKRIVSGSLAGSASLMTSSRGRGGAARWCPFEPALTKPGRVCPPQHAFRCHPIKHCTGVAGGREHGGKKQHDSGAEMTHGSIRDEALRRVGRVGAIGGLA
jgi:hypothetical protein